MDKDGKGAAASTSKPMKGACRERDKGKERERESDGRRRQAAREPYPKETEEEVVSGREGQDAQSRRAGCPRAKGGRPSRGVRRGVVSKRRN